MSSVPLVPHRASVYAFQEVTTVLEKQDMNFQMAPRLAHSDIRRGFPYRVAEKIEPMTVQWLEICPAQTSGWEPMNL